MKPEYHYAGGFPTTRTQAAHEVLMRLRRGSGEADAALIQELRAEGWPIRKIDVAGGFYYLPWQGTILPNESTAGPIRQAVHDFLGTKPKTMKGPE